MTEIEAANYVAQFCKRYALNQNEVFHYNPLAVIKEARTHELLGFR
jgi:hypothetical protein